LLTRPIFAPLPEERTDLELVDGLVQDLAAVDSHLIKYPYSFYALARELRDDALKQRILEKIYYLTAVS